MTIFGYTKKTKLVIALKKDLLQWAKISNEKYLDSSPLFCYACKFLSRFFFNIKKDMDC
jgi:hypothetical protein